MNIKNSFTKRNILSLIGGGTLVVAIIVLIFAVAGGSDETPTDTNTPSQGVEAESKQNVDGEIGDYVCKVKSADICKNWEGKNSVKVVYEFTNNYSEPRSFDTALEAKLFQEGIGLETTFISGDDDNAIYDVEIKPGTTKDVVKYYVLRDTTTTIEVEIAEWISFNDEKITTTITL